jgi:Putative beta-barrel porin-2, OmpL-like. bbp2
MGLAAAGVISFAAVAQAEEKPTHQVLTAVSSTALSGYVSTSVGWTPGNTVNTAGRYSFQKNGDGFNLDVIDIKLSSALAEGEWASGYNVELWLGPDAAGLGHNLFTAGAGNGGNIAIKNANVALNIPVGNGIQAKIGIFDTVVGYESANSIDNPNYSRSRGYSIEPTTHTGVLLSYKVSDALSVNAGVANTLDGAGALNSGSRLNNSQLTYLASASLTAPDSLGFLKGAVLTAGVVDGYNSGAAVTLPDNTLVYVGATLPTGIDKLTLGLAWDHLNIDKSSTDQDALAAYLSLKTCEKSSLNLRAEYNVAGTGAGNAGEFLATTLTMDYKLWANVVSRVEYRWDHDLNAAKGAATTGVVASRNNSHSFVAQIAYKF